MIDDTHELLRRIYEYSDAFSYYGKKPALFRLTPYEHTLFKRFLLTQVIQNNEYFGDLPTFYGVNFELVGKPLLFSGKHIRNDLLPYCRKDTK